MTRRVDGSILTGFLAEVRGYLPEIRAGVDALRAPDGRLEVLLETAHRHAHSVRGVAAMMGRWALSHLASSLERALEEVAAGCLDPGEPTVRALHRAVALLDSCLEISEPGAAEEGPLLEEAVVLFRRVRGLPESGDAAAVAEVLAHVAAGLPPTADGGEPDRHAGPANGRCHPPGENLGGEDAPRRPEADAPAGEAETVDPELLAVFQLEAEDHLRSITSRLPALRERPGDRTVVQEVRRSAHTLKGSAAMVGFRTLTRLAHRMEDLLDLLYEGGREATPGMIDLLAASAETLEDLAGGGSGAAVLPDLYARYEQTLAEAGADGPAPADGPPGAAAPPTEEADEERAAGAAPAEQSVRVPLARLDELVRLAGELAIARNDQEQKLAAFARQVEELKRSTERLRRVTARLETQYEASTLGGGRWLQGTSFPEYTSGALSLRSVTRQTHGFDDLEFDRYTEFHLLARELGETTADLETVSDELAQLDREFGGQQERQGRLFRDLQDRLLRTRMVPFGDLEGRLRRTVRGVAQARGKLLDLVLEGEGTEVDKTLLGEMADPLLHLLRNAADHGIEPPEVRRARGKPERGTVWVRVFHEGNQVAIQVADDGAGIDREAVRARAVARGLVPAAAAEGLGEAELLALPFLPGFSTAEQVSEVSGRGVGLDVVKERVARLKGTVALASRPDEGATFTVRLPMTLAVMKALLVRAHGQTFALPLASVAAITRPGGEDDEPEGPGRVRYGEMTYPRLTLGEALGFPPAPDEAAPRPPVVVAHAGDGALGLAVDQLLGAREVVVKNLGSHLRHVHGVSGATLLGDGAVVLIVNPADLLHPPVRPATVRVAPEANPAGHRALTVLVVDDSPSVRRVVTRLLAGAGWTALPARDGLEALEVLQRGQALPDVILLDIEMPRMDGYELLAAVKSEAAYRDVPVVMVTSRAGSKHRRKAEDLGADGFVVKPYQDEQLLETVRRLAARAKRVD